MKLIDKAAVLAEINKLKGKVDDGSSYCNGWQHALRMLEIELNTLEVKEVQEEPVSEELIDATNNYCVVVRKGYPRVMDETDRYICNAFKAGANWQKEQMMAKAIETTFNVSLPSGLYDKLWIKGCKEGDKLLVIKKDEL